VLDRLVGEARRRWAMDPGAGLQVVAVERLVATPIEPSRPVIVAPLATLAGAVEGMGSDDAGGAGQATGLPASPPLPPEPPAPLAGRHGPDGRDPLAVLGRLYPADHPAGRFGADAGTTVGALTVADLDAPFYLAPVAPELASAGPWSMAYIADRLRRPDGCPWDREQTHQSLRKHLLEETYEVYDALEHGATPGLAEELGDLLLQVVLHAQLAAEAGVFDLADVQASISRKIVRRHPHVFGDAVAETAADVLRQWERIKAVERADAAAGAADAGAAEDGAEGPAAALGPKGALDGISRSLPALAASQEMQERAAALGYDWPSIEGVLDKVAEELGELARAESSEDRREEFGDLLLVVVNVGRKLGIETEGALRAANEKFRGRFRRIERMVAERGVAIRDLDFATLDALWDAATAEERAT
jgi:tetrapyrrole methylase family protein/MazG family protein